MYKCDNLNCVNIYSSRQAKFVHMKKCTKKLATTLPLEVLEPVKKIKTENCLSSNLKMDLESIALRMLHSKCQFDSDWINDQLKNVVSFANFYKATTSMKDMDILRNAILKVSNETSISSTNAIKKYENLVSSIKKEIQNIKNSADSSDFDKSLYDEKRKFITEIRKIQDRNTGNSAQREDDGSIPETAIHAVSYNDLIKKREQLRLDRLLLEFKEFFLDEEEAFRLNLVKSIFAQLSFDEFTMKSHDNSKSQNY